MKLNKSMVSTIFDS